MTTVEANSIRYIARIIEDGRELITSDNIVESLLKTNNLFGNKFESAMLTHAILIAYEYMDEEFGFDADKHGEDLEWDEILKIVYNQFTNEGIDLSLYENESLN